MAAADDVRSPQELREAAESAENKAQMYAKKGMHLASKSWANHAYTLRKRAAERES